jgi:hypothetical protein
LDSAHIEICRIGSFHEKWGGVPMEELEKIMTDGTIEIPEIAVIPTGIVSNEDIPPEVEVRFDMKENVFPDHFFPATDELYSMEYDANNISNNKGVNVEEKLTESGHAKLLIGNVWNWQIRFVHNQLFKYSQNYNRFWPGPFHMTFVRKATLKNNNARRDYFDKCEATLNLWEIEGPKIVTAGNQSNTNIQGQKNEVDGTRILGIIEYLSQLTNPYGVYLFKDRNTIVCEIF